MSGMLRTHLRSVAAIARKDTLDLWRNKATLGGLLYPILMALLFLLISRLVGGSTTDFLVYNPGGSGVAAAATAGFANAEVIQASSAAEVADAFGSDGSAKSGAYAAGLIVPADFDSALRDGGHPQITVYFNGATLQSQSQALVKAAIQNYARAAALPEVPADIVIAVINKPASVNTGALLGKVYTPLVLLLSLVIGTTFVPTLLIEEKERKTLRMLMVSPASFLDVLLAKLGVVLVYQFALTCIVVAIEGGFSGQIGLVLLFALLGGCFSLALGLLFGSAFDTQSSATATEGIVIVIYILAGIFVGPLGEIIGGSGVVSKIVRLLPTYYVADGVYNASQNTVSAAGNLIDIGVIVFTTAVLLALSTWILRRRSGTMALF
jgi:ABC-2 type transport system permease protein